MNTSHYCKRLALLALLGLLAATPALADTVPATAIANVPAAATIHLAWDRVGSPLQA